ncbi:hypothetical protein [Acinetobacter ursingii]|uniref:hypothetical protein n=1 Tax=Acinetobacter ursingii TaxID=108980 RepID=UPI00124DEE76|nr:hypothetical protein [Acinetobacter ursingii]
MLVSEVIYQTLSPIFSDRVAPHPMPKDYVKSETYVTYQGISEDPLNTVKTWTGYELKRVQVNIYNHDNIQCERDALSVKAALCNQKLSSCVLIASREGGMDEDTQLYQYQCDFEIWQNI